MTIRDRCIELAQAGHPPAEIARRLNISRQHVSVELGKARKKGLVLPSFRGQPRQGGGGPMTASPPWSPEERAALEAMAAAGNLTVEQLVIALVRDILADDAAAEAGSIPPPKAAPIDVDRLIKAVLAAWGSGHFGTGDIAARLGLQAGTVRAWLAAWAAETKGRKVA